MRVCILFAFLLFINLENSFSQTLQEKELILNVVHHKNNAKQYTYAYQNKNELQLVFSGLFLFYKSFISSQDSHSCSFRPSCSEYGLLCVKKFGAIKGILHTFDRLTRCNGLSPEHYEFDVRSGLLIDNP
jgi:uncharacterized protein